jgi:hypothetical protein
MAVQWPLVKAALVSTWQTACGPTDAVYAGVPTTSDLPSRWVTVGYMETGTGPASGTWKQTLANDGFQYDEAGEVHCTLEVQSGDDEATTEASAFAFYGVLDSAVRSSKRLGGVLSGNGYIELTGELIPYASGTGSRTVMAITVTYLTTTL